MARRLVAGHSLYICGAINVSIQFSAAQLDCLVVLLLTALRTFIACLVSPCRPELLPSQSKMSMHIYNK